jgi:hypothetical protein
MGVSPWYCVLLISSSIGAAYPAIVSRTYGA